MKYDGFWERGLGGRFAQHNKKGGRGLPFPERQNPIPPIPMSENFRESEIPIPLYPPMVLNTS